MITSLITSFGMNFFPPFFPIVFVSICSPRSLASNNETNNSQKFENRHVSIPFTSLNPTMRKYIKCTISKRPNNLRFGGSRRAVPL